MARGRLRIYLGAAPGVGKTYAMLAEGHRRAERGTDVVVGFVETHGRVLTAQMADGLEIVPRRTISYRGADFTEMDRDAVLARRPQVALVDELAHTNVPGAEHDKRWQDVDALLDAGIDVISTVNIQHLESLNDVVEEITGIKQRETIPDDVVRNADQIELVDMSPEALRRRLAHGNVYQPEKIDAALGNYFRVGNLTALRELALLWLADRVDEGLARYRREHGIDETWPARERVVVALTGGPEGDELIRGAARIASRGAGGELLGVYVTRSDGLTGASAEALERQRFLLESLHGTFHSVAGDDVARAILDFARGVNASQIVIGVSRRGRLQSLFGSGIGATVIRDSGDIDVHVVTHDYAGRGRVRTAGRAAVSRRRTIAGWVLALMGPILLTACLAATRGLHGLPTELMLFMTLAVGVALVGGLWPAITAAFLGGLLLNYYFAPPLYTLTIRDPENALAIVVFVVVAAAVASVVDLASRRTLQAARAGAEAETLSFLAGSVLRGDRALPALLERVRESFGMTMVALLRRQDEHAPWVCLESVGEGPVCAQPQDADVEVPVSDNLALALVGRVLPADDRRVLEAFAAQAAVVVEREQLSREALEARRAAEGNEIRTALLAAVSHDLRTPLASIKALVGTLRATDVSLSPADEMELLAAIEESTDRLGALVDNLLDMSRLETGTVRPLLEPVGLDEVVPAALRGLPDDASLSLAVPESLPALVADAGLLERVVANVIENAVKFSPPGVPVLVAGSAARGRVELRVVDRGPGVPDEAKSAIFEPFQRLGDAPRARGVGLGLAVARGFTEAMNGSLLAEDTPGGGLTMVISLPSAVPTRSDEAQPAQVAG